jgi:hypothetical protein
MAESFGSSPTNNSLSTSSNSSASSLSHSRQTPISSSFPSFSPGSIYTLTSNNLSPGNTTLAPSATSTASSTPTEKNGPWPVRHNTQPPQQQPQSQVYHPPTVGRTSRTGLASSYMSSLSSSSFLPGLSNNLNVSGSQPASVTISSLLLANPPYPSRINHELDAQSNRWHTICVKVLPLFNGEGLKMPIEDLNELVRFVVPVLV